MPIKSVFRLLKAGHDVHFLETTQNKKPYDLPHGITNHFVRLTGGKTFDLRSMWTEVYPPQVREVVRQSQQSPVASIDLKWRAWRIPVSTDYAWDIERRADGLLSRLIKVGLLLENFHKNCAVHFNDKKLLSLAGDLLDIFRFWWRSFHDVSRGSVRRILLCSTLCSRFYTANLVAKPFHSRCYNERSQHLKGNCFVDLFK